jgi:delta24(24(1))-sterol reductase
MTGFPILMYYLWICLWFYDGKLVHPNSVDDVKPFLGRMWGHIVKVSIYASFGTKIFLDATYDTI